MTATFPGPGGQPASSRVPVDSASTADLRQYLSERLPPHMVPGVIVALKALPLTPNRKVDFAALPDPPETGYYQAPREAAAVAPADEREEAVAAIWREVLNVDELSVHDDFFQLGGSSLAVMRVLAQLWKRHGIRIAVADFFEQPTIRALARRLEVATGVV